MAPDGPSSFLGRTCLALVVALVLAPAAASAQFDASARRSRSRGAARLLESESSDRGQVIGREQIVNLPLNGRAYADVALLSPDVRRSAIADSRDASFNVHGLRSALNSFILDGVDNNSYAPATRRLESGRAGLARCGRGVQGPDQQLQRGVRPHGRRSRQRLDAQRHERFPRHDLGVQPERCVERGRLLQAVERCEAEAEPQPVRVRVRRTAHPQPHVLLHRLFNNTTSFVWELPFGRDRRFGNALHPIAEGLLGNWRLVGINTMTSGVPINLSYSPAAAFTVSGSPTYRPNLLGDPLTPSGERTINNYLNGAMVEIPTDRTQPFGNAPRNAARAPAFYQFDLGLHKSFTLGSTERRIEARVEAFNLFNQVNFGPANGNRSSSAFGTISTTYPARQLQLGVKLHF